MSHELNSPRSPVPDHLQQQWSVPGGPWDCRDLGTELSTALQEWPTSVLFAADDQGPVTAAEFQQSVTNVAGGLQARGVGHGDLVVVHGGVSIPTLAGLHAVWQLGAVAAPVHHRLDSSFLNALATRTGAALTLSDDDLSALVANEQPVPLTPSNRPVQAAAVVLMTSGTSGAPKAALHTHRSVGPKARLLLSVHGLTPNDVVLMPAPLGHMSGLLNGVLLPAFGQMTTVLMARWSPAKALDLIEKYGVTFMVGPPTFFLDLMNAPDFHTARVASLRLISTGGSQISPMFVQRARRLLGATVKRTYGSTEAPTVTTSRPDDPAERAVLTDGRATPHTEVRIVDENGRPVMNGPGLIEVRGPEVFAGYLDADEQPFTNDGWYHTGDIGSLSDGWLTVAGRADELIIRGGENVDPISLTAALLEHPSIIAAAVVGVPDKRLGQRIGVAVVASAELPELPTLREWLADAGLPHCFLPDQVVAVGSIPELDSKKPDRRALRALFTD